MLRVPQRLKGNTSEAAWHNQMRDVVMSLMPIQSANNKTTRTPKGTIIEGTAAGKKGTAGTGQAVWL